MTFRILEEPQAPVDGAWHEADWLRSTRDEVGQSPVGIFARALAWLWPNKTSRACQVLRGLPQEGAHAGSGHVVRARQLLGVESDLDDHSSTARVTRPERRDRRLSSYTATPAQS